MTRSEGLHHVTIMASDPGRNLAFYTKVLGLRFIKKTVNFDDPSLYHLYYGDTDGTPGTALTFFPMPGIGAGRAGIGETSETMFAAPIGSLSFWTQRLVEHAVWHDAPEKRFGETVLPFRDPDGTRLAIAFTGDAGDNAWTEGGIAREHAIRGFHGVTLLLREEEATARVLTEVFGYEAAAREGSRVRYSAKAAPELGAHVDLHVVGDFLPGRAGGGTVHHIAFRAKDDATAFAMRDALAQNLRINATEQKDRNYFRSIYFREPGGVLFEIATDEPGFLIDEDRDSLGKDLKLPPAYEKHRQEIERHLPELVQDA